MSNRCVQEVYGIAKTNWDAFVGPDIVDLYGHLMIYPMLVNQDGRYAPFQHTLIFCVMRLSGLDWQAMCMPIKQ